jgi:TonB family protein
MEIFIYAAKVGLYWGLFYLFYQLLLRRYTFFFWNRFYLVGTLVASLVLPFVSYPESAPDVPVIYQATMQIATIQYHPTPVSDAFPWIELISAIYFTGVVLALLVFVKRIKELFSFIRSGEIVELDECTLVLIDHNHIGSFSFLKWIVINKSDYEFNLDTILRHETAHIDQKHSVDILLIEILRIVFWFNPILYLYKNALQEIHEFLADETAVDKEQYAYFLLRYALNVPSAALSNHFFKTSQIRKRIGMIYKNRSPKWVKGSYLLILLCISMITMGIAGFEKVNSRREGSIITELNANLNKGFNVAGRDTNAENKRASTATLKATRPGTSKDKDFTVQVRPGDAPDSSIALQKTSDDKNESNGTLTAALERILTPSDFLFDVPGLQFPEPENRPALTLHEPIVEKAQPTEQVARVFTVVESQPEFPGGIRAMYKFLENNIKYPVAAKKASVSGRVFLSFVISDEGKISNISILKGLGFGCDQEAVRVVSAFPRWKPGRQNSIPVSVRYNLPINFQLIDERTGRIKTDRAASKKEDTKTITSPAHINSPKVDLALTNIGKPSIP